MLCCCTLLYYCTRLPQRAAIRDKRLRAEEIGGGVLQYCYTSVLIYYYSLLIDARRFATSG